MSPTARRKVASDALVVAQEPLLNPATEARRLDFALSQHVMTEEAGRLGLGETDDARMRYAMAIPGEICDLPRAPTAAEILDCSFLPPRDEHQP